MEIPRCRNKLVPHPLLNAAVNSQSSNAKACPKKLSQILADNIDNGGRGIGLRIHVRYCRYSGINQPLSIIHEIFKSFGEGFEVKSVFPDTSKAFDKVWHNGLTFKLSQNGIPGKLLDITSDFLSNIKQRVVLNGQKSTWENVNVGVPQGSILRLLFL